MKEWKIIFLLTAAAFIFRTLIYTLFASEIVVGADQMQNIVLGCHFAAGDFYGVLDVYWTPLYPILIGTLNYFINSIIYPSVIISIIAGSLAVPLTYYLTRQSYGRREAVIAAVIAVFYPHLINSVFALGTENIYLIWVVGAIIIGWQALKEISARKYFAVGVLLGLAYLTRPEAFGYPVLFALLMLFKNLCAKNFSVKHLLAPMLALTLGFFLFGAPYLFYLKSATGSWMISGKTAINTIAAEYSDDYGAENGEPATGFNLAKGKVLVKSFGINLIIIHKEFPYLVPLFLVMLVALGLFGGIWEKRRLEREIYLIIFCLVTIVGYALAAVQTRYFYVLLPIFFGWIARGIVHIERKFRQSFQSRFSEKLHSKVSSPRLIAASLILIYIYVLPINFFMRSETDSWQSNAVEERDAGIWLKEHGKPAPLIFSASFRPIFYAEGKPFPVKTNKPDVLLTQIKNYQADYIVTSERSLKRHPYLQTFDEELRKSNDFELVYENERQEGYRISIFVLKQ